MLDYTQHDGGESEADDITVDGSEANGEQKKCSQKPDGERNAGSDASDGVESCRSSTKSAPYSGSKEDTSHQDLSKVHTCS